MSESELPLADRGQEQMARQMMSDGVSPEEYAARGAHTMGSFSLGDVRYSDPALQAWVHALAAILFQRPGTPTLEELRKRFLSEDEREAIRRRSLEDF